LRNYGIPIGLDNNKIIPLIGSLHYKENTFNNTITYYYYPDGFKQSENPFTEAGIKYKGVHLPEDRKISNTYDIVEAIMIGLV
jgi:hypothetical protein